MSDTRKGRYELVARIATGGMGEVWRAEDTVLDREVAVKVLKHEYADDPTFRARFEAEARHAGALHHPNVASVFDIGELVEDDGSGTRRPFLVMELVPGKPLSELLRGGEAMPPERASEVVAQAADAIAAAHAIGIVHRDVKPANLLVTPEGTVKITDFGIARVADGAAVTQTGQIIGTPHYISPEQAEGHPATEASDIYALGVVLYECLAGRRPFARDTPIQVALAHIREQVPPLAEDVPARLRAIVDRALAKDPADRFASATEMAAALRGATVPGLVMPGGPAGAAAAAAPDATQVLTHVPSGGSARGSARGSAPATAGASARRRRRGLPPWWPWAAAAVAALALVVGVAFAADRGNEPAAARVSTSDEPSAEPTDDRFRVREAAYLGLDFAEAEAELEAHDLEVVKQTVPATSPDQVKDTVAAVSPTGPVDPGTTVEVEVFEEYVAPDDDDESDDAGVAPGKSDEKPGKGKSNGKSKGKKD